MARTGTTTLYVVVDQTKVTLENLGEIKNDRGLQDASPDLTGVNSLRRSVAYSISQVIPFVNSKDLLRYLPDGMLNENQRTAKWEAIAETVKYTNEKNDEKYAKYIAKGDMRSAKQMVLGAAKAANVFTDEKGKPIDLYHGTPNFGFTQFKDGLIFATSNPSIAAGYTANKGWGRVRQISRKYKQDDGTLKTLIENAKNILETEVHQITPKEQKAIRDEIKAQADELSERINNAWTNEAIDTLGDGLDYDALCYVLTLAGTISENIDEIGNYYSVSGLEHDIDLFDRHYSEVKEYFAERRDEIKGTPAWDLYKLILGYDLGDFAIDARYKLLRSLDDTVLVSEGGGLASQETVRNNIEKVKDVGAYHLYGIKGDNPLIIDAQKHSWLDIRVDGWEDRWYSTEQIGKIAKEKGYTSVVIKNVYDMSGNEYAVNIPSDIYIFFDSNQLKSADTITYDDNDNIIPLSERFNPKNSDIRYSHKADKKATYSSASVMYQHRNSNDMKPRTLLVNALETAVSEKERNLLQTYKDNIDKLNAEQEKLEKVMEEADKIQFRKSLSISGEEMSVATFERRAKAKAKKNGINADDVQFKLDRSNSKYIAYAVGQGTILEADKTFRSAEDNAKLKELYAEGKSISKYQQNGTRTNYDYAFGANAQAANGWDDELFKPKYDISMTNTQYMFRHAKITNLKQILIDCGVRLINNSQALYYTFNSSSITHIPALDGVAITNCQFTFNGCTNLVSIDKLKVDETCLFDAAFINCSALENIIIEGTIGVSTFNVQWSTKLSKASITSIINALSTTKTGLTVTLSKAAKEAAFTADEWAALIATKSNWTISLV